MFKVTIVTPEKRLVLNQEASSVIIPAHRGQLTILPGHSPIMTTLDTGVLRWKIAGAEDYEKAAISWGYCEVNPEGVFILADIAHLPAEIEESAQEGIIKAGLEKLGRESLDDTNWALAQREVALARTSIEIMPLTKRTH